MLITPIRFDSDLPQNVRGLAPKKPGVLIMTHRPLTFSYMNAEARAIINHLHRLEWGTVRSGLPKEIRAFCLDLLETLNDRCDMDRVSPFELARDIVIAGTPIVFRGLGLPRSSDVDQDRMCVFIEIDRNLSANAPLNVEAKEA